MKKRYFVKVDCKDDYAKIFEIASKRSFEWQNKEYLDDLLQAKNPTLWLVEIKWRERKLQLITSIIGCASICTRYRDSILNVKDVEYLFSVRPNMTFEAAKYVEVAKKRYKYACVEDSDNGILVVAQTIDDRCSTMESAMRYYFNYFNAERLKSALQRITNEDIETALVQLFYKFTHVETWFDAEEFEEFCKQNDIKYRKSIEVLFDDVVLVVSDY